ncbi:MAG: methyl-accepting chemotaxis protein [Clostridia bacterium]|nr:methyl-accepting chemotaxis protein [Clostridia bacterium]
MSNGGFFRYKPFYRLAFVFILITGGGTLIWTSFLTQYLHASKEEITTLFLAVIPVGFISGLLILLYVNHLLNNLIKTFLEANNKVAEGDLTQAIYFPSTDIFGRMAEAFNKMARDIREMVTQSSEIAMGVASEAAQVSSAVEHATASIEQISAAVEQIAGGNTRQADQMMSTLHTIQELSGGVQQIAANSQLAFSNSQRAATSAEKGAVEVERAVTKMHVIADTVTNSTRAVHKFNERSEHIGEIVNVITGLADQTNLVALNAAIEAARAGEYGRGFAVVADEVKKLAEGSGAAAQQIGELINEIRRETTNAAEAMAVGSREVTEGVSVANEAKKALEEIVQAVKETEIMVQQISVATHEQSQGINQVVAAVDNVTAIAQQSSVAMQQVSASVQQQMSNNEKISIIAANLASLAENLRTKINRFKIR